MSVSAVARAPQVTEITSVPRRVGLVSWGAIWGGVAGSLVAQLLLSLVGVGIGLATLSPASDGVPSAASASAGALIWLVVSAVLASAAGGWLAGRLSGASRETGGLHGLIVWAVSTLLIVALLSSAIGGVASGAFGALSSVTSAIGSTMKNTAQTAAQIAAPGLPTPAAFLSSIQDQVKSATNDQDPAALRAEAAKAIGAVITGGDQKAALDRATDLLARARNIPADQARSQIAQFTQQYRATVEEAKQKAAEAAETAAHVSATAALVSALVLLVGAMAAGFAGYRGARA